MPTYLVEKHKFTSSSRSKNQ